MIGASVAGVALLLLIVGNMGNDRGSGSTPTPTTVTETVTATASPTTVTVSDPPQTVTVTQAAPAPRLFETAPPAAPQAPPSSVYYPNCDTARRAGAAPILVGEPAYRSGLDRDGDGVACE